MPEARHTSDPTMLLIPSELDSQGVVRSRDDGARPAEHYTRYLFSKIRPFIRGRVCEIGSGTGQLTAYLADCDRVTAVEPYGPYHVLAMRELAYQFNITHVRCTLEACPNERVPAGAFDTVLCVGLLEHLEYDITALEILGDLCGPGQVIVVVPAGRRLYNRLDQRSGHLRRYSVDLLRTAFHEAGLTVTLHRHFDLPGMVSWWWRGVMQRRACFSSGGGRWLRTATALERRWRLPVGHSLMMIGRPSPTR